MASSCASSTRPHNSSRDLDNTPTLTTKAMWQIATAYTLDDAMAIIGPYVFANAPACSWRAYGVGIVGEPGGSRRIVFVIAE